MKEKFVKKRSFIFIMLMVVALVLTSCTSPGDETATPDEPENNESTHGDDAGAFDEEPMDMVMLGGSHWVKPKAE
jgi:PBP1b-binding outer membrane lipoprotein LpoB